jgi:glycosyltransferase involved in cell wall biosynthesis
VTARVLFIAYHFPPTGGSGVQRSSKFVRYLPAEGFAPVVVTGPGEGGARWSPPDASLGADVADDVPVLRVPGPVPGDGSGPAWRARRLLRMQTPFDRWWEDGVRRLGRTRDDVSLVYASMSPFSSAAAAAAVADDLGVPWVADLRDPWALDEYVSYPTGVHWRIERRAMRRGLASAAAVVLPTPGTLARVVHFFPELSDRVFEVRNGFDPADFTGPPSEPEDERFHVVHTGSFYADLGRRRARRLLGGTDLDVDPAPRSPSFLLAAVDRLLAANPELRGRLTVELAGQLTAEDVAVVDRARCRDVVTVHGYLPHTQAVSVVRSADALFLPMHGLPRGVRSTIVPGKLYEYLASGRPVLGAVPEGDARDLLERSPWTVVTEPDDVSGIAAGLLTLYREREPRRLRTADRRGLLLPFERPQLAARLAEVFARAIQGPASGR